MRLFSLFLVGFLLNIITSVYAADASDYSDTLKRLLADEAIQLTDAKLQIDKLIDPNVDAERTTQQIDDMAKQATILAGRNASASDKVAALKLLIYKPGKWNENQAFHYDFENPRGRLAVDKTLASYINNRKGNCVSMPLLFLSVAEQMDIPMNITTAPTHMFIQFEDPDTGNVQHLEPTSGADPQRIAWQRQVLPMTDRAIESGMYMKRLNKREMIAVMAETLLQDLTAKDWQQERMEVAQVILSAFPQNDVALLHLRDSYAKTIEKRFILKYPSPAQIPENERTVYQRWAKAHFEIGAKLKHLGWRPVKNIGTPNASFADEAISGNLSAVNMVPTPSLPPNPNAYQPRPNVDLFRAQNPMQHYMPQIPQPTITPPIPHPGVRQHNPNHTFGFPN